MGGAYVAGTRGNKSDANVDLAVGLASGRSQVIGVDAGIGVQDAQAEVLLGIFAGLDGAKRLALLGRALELQNDKSAWVTRGPA